MASTTKTKSVQPRSEKKTPAKRRTKRPAADPPPVNVSVAPPPPIPKPRLRDNPLFVGLVSSVASAAASFAFTARQSPPAQPAPQYVRLDPGEGSRFLEILRARFQEQSGSLVYREDGTVSVLFERRDFDRILDDLDWMTGRVPVPRHYPDPNLEPFSRSRTYFGPDDEDLRPAEPEFERFEPEGRLSDGGPSSSPTS